MIDKEALQFASSLIGSWNSRSLESVLAYYSDGIEFSSPFVREITGEGRVVGKPALRAYWSAVLEAKPHLLFELCGVLVGDQCLTMLYYDHRGLNMAETLELDQDRTVIRSFACYSR